MREELKNEAGERKKIGGREGGGQLRYPSPFVDL